MINKERLEELIKQGVSVYWRVGRKIKPYLWNKYTLCEHAIVKNNLEYIYDYVDLFETEEEAIFAEKYQNITRTETLSLSTWEEFQKKIYAKSQFIFRDRNGINWFLKDTLKGTTTIILLTNGVAYFKCDYNKKGYLEICEKCKKIFLGEEK